ncbi:IS110 family transposase [Nitrobacter sp. Nb-311A]|uniref:IS110 family transposase n=1 Tax=Nitrobacter sp. Nb-311A TaxID=314253 RepID=UPI0035275C72
MSGYGIAMRPGAGVFKLDMARILADETNDLTPMMRTMLRELWDEFVVVDARLATVSRQVEAIADRVDAARRLMSIPGIGPLGATALLAAIGDGRQFRKARDLAAWLGLVPRQNSTGGRTTLLGISKRGNPYLRRLIIHGARSCIAHLNRERDRMGEWIGRLEQRMHRNKVVVAFANKIARMAWAVLTRPGNLYERVDPARA